MVSTCFNAIKCHKNNWSNCVSSANKCGKFEFDMLEVSVFHLLPQRSRPPFCFQGSAGCKRSSCFRLNAIERIRTSLKVEYTEDVCLGTYNFVRLCSVIDYHDFTGKPGDMVVVKRLVGCHFGVKPLVKYVASTTMMLSVPYYI